MMKKLFSLLLLVFSVCTFSCHSTSEKVKEVSAKPASMEDSLYKQTMYIHNEVMAKMGKLMGYEKQAQKQSDSIKTILASTEFPKYMAQKIAKDLNALDSLSENLKAADKAMNDWMEQFEPDPKMPTTEERATYFADQKAKATTMRNQFFETYRQAEQFFEGKK